MSNQRYYQSFKSSQEGGSNTNKVSPRVSVNRPVPRSNYNRVERGEVNSGYGSNTQSSYEPPRSIPSMNNVEKEFIEEKAKKRSSSTAKKVFIGFLAVVLLLGIFLGGAYLSSTGNMPFADNNSILNGGQGNNKPNILGSNKGDKFDGQPVPVKWPTDVRPTRMEMQLDPNTGEVILLLVGEKEGVGTILRSYNKNGNLTGYWIITPDETTPQQSNNQQQNNNQQQQKQQSNMTPEQEVAVATHQLIGNHLEGKNAEQILQEFGTQLGEIGKKYNLSAEQVLQVYIKVAQDYQQQNNQQQNNQQQNNQQQNNQQQQNQQQEQQQQEQQGGN